MEREREREHPRLTSAPKTCPLDDCKDRAMYLSKLFGAMYLSKLFGRDPCLRNGMGIGALEFIKERMAAVLPCERAGVQLLILVLSTGHICVYEHDDILLVGPHAARDAGNEMAIARAARVAMPEFLRIISGSCKLTPSDFAVPSTVALICKDHDKFAHGYYLTNTNTGSTDGPKFLTTGGSCKLVLPEFAGASTVGSRLEGMMPLVCAADASLSMAGGGSAQTGPDHHGMHMVEPDDLKLDSGASNHVVGEKTFLHGYQSLPRPWPIHVADGYPLEVIGFGSIIIPQKFFIPKVYRVKGLKSNLISVSQLATDHGLLSVFDGSKCEVLKRDWERVGGGFLQANGIYKLSFLEVPDAEAGYERA